MEEEKERLCGLLRRLERPAGRADVVLDTDTFNEIDDQYALSYLVRSGDRLRLRAVCAAPFFNENSASPADGMERSYQEIRKILALLGREDLIPEAYRGSDRYLPDEKTPVRSPAAERIARLAMEYTPGRPLYIVAIGAITNVASALLLDGRIRDRVVIVWLGGNARDWPDTREFNLSQDIAAARVVFDSGAAVVQLPCMGVVSSFATTGPELEHWLRGKNRLCDYLVELTERAAAASGAGPVWSRAIWDVTAVAWLLGGSFMRDRLETSPIVQYDSRYSFDPGRHFIRYVYHIDRDRLFADLFAKLAGPARE